jgi:hypothetical protein
MLYKNIEKRKKYIKEYYLNNKKRLDIYRKEYLLKNKERIKEKRRLYNLKNKEIKRLYYLNNKEILSKVKKKYRLNNIEKIKKYRIQYSLNNQDKIKRTNKLYNLNNKDKIKEYHLKNPHIQKSINAKRRAMKLRATPKFANLKKIKEIYKNCPKGYHVDHIIPLQGKNVCGLHVEWNLQYLTPSANYSKSNKLII